MNINNDIEYFLSQKQSELDNIVAGMTALMLDSENKYETLKNQNWFKRMILTVTGKNKATTADIQKNSMEFDAYCTKAVAAFVEHQKISEGITFNLGLQINSIYDSHIELKHALYGIASNLNERIESADNYHLLFEEITLGNFGGHNTDIYRILALFDAHTITDTRKMDNMEKLLRKNNILKNGSISIEDYLLNVCDIPDEHVGVVFMETLLHSDSLPATMTSAVLSEWNLAPLTNRQLMKKQNIVKKILNSFDVDGEAEFSLSDEYQQLVENKRILLGQVAVTSIETDAEFDDDLENDRLLPEQEKNIFIETGEIESTIEIIRQIEIEEESTEIRQIKSIEMNAEPTEAEPIDSTQIDEESSEDDLTEEIEKIEETQESTTPEKIAEIEKEEKIKENNIQSRGEDYKARITMFAKGSVNLITKHFKASPCKIYPYGDIDGKMHEKAFRHIVFRGDRDFIYYPDMRLPESPTEKIIMIMDTSFSGKIKEGAIFTTEGVYLGSVSKSNAKYYPYSSIQRVGFKKGSSFFDMDKLIIETAKGPELYDVTSIRKDMLSYALNEIIKLRYQLAL